MDRRYFIKIIILLCGSLTFNPSELFKKIMTHKKQREIFFTNEKDITGTVNILYEDTFFNYKISCPELNLSITNRSKKLCSEKFDKVFWDKVFFSNWKSFGCFHV